MKNNESLATIQKFSQKMSNQREIADRHSDGCPNSLIFTARENKTI